MSLEKKDFEAIEEYLKEALPRILIEQSLGKPPAVYEIELRERMVRVEEELRNQRELMKQGFDMTDRRFEDMQKSMDKRFEDMQKLMDRRFEQVDKRFEQVDKRFEQVDRRFEQVDKRFEQVDKRFEDINSRFKMMFAFMSLGFTVLAVMMTAFKFIR